MFPKPLRGDVWLADFGIAAKTRPCLILSDFPTGNERSLIMVVPHTTSLRGTPWEIQVPKAFLQPGAFDIQQLGPIPTPRLMRRIGVLTDEELNSVLDGICKFLAL